jgi:hypothetical protein
MSEKFNPKPKKHLILDMETDSFTPHARMGLLCECVPELSSSTLDLFQTLSASIQSEIINSIQQKIDENTNKGEIINYAVNLIDGYYKFESIDSTVSYKHKTPVKANDDTQEAEAYGVAVTDNLFKKLRVKNPDEE